MLLLDRSNFQVNSDRGSANLEQIYVECSTANYEYMRRYLVRILIDKLQCTEDVNKRRVRTVKDMKGDVEAQYTIQFLYDDVKLCCICDIVLYKV